MQALEEDDLKEAEKYQVPREIEVMVEVGMGISLPDDKKYKVLVKIAEFEVLSDEPKYFENNYNRWGWRSGYNKETKKYDPIVFKGPYKDVYDIGQVFIYLMDGKVPVCYARARVSDFLEPDPKMKWLEMINDLAIGKVDEAHEAGFISLKMTINDRTANAGLTFSKYTAWKKPPLRRMNIKKVRAYIYQCRDLPAADSDGQSDPFIKVWDTSKDPKQTIVIEDNINPLYYETLELLYETLEIEDLPPFILDVYDKDFGICDGDDFIGRCMIPINECAYRTNEDEEMRKSMSKEEWEIWINEPERPKWHPVRVSKDAPPSGEVLVSFAIVTDDFNFKTPIEYFNLVDFVPFDEYVIEINILGLRDL